MMTSRASQEYVRQRPKVCVLVGYSASASDVHWIISNGVVNGILRNGNVLILPTPIPSSGIIRDSARDSNSDAMVWTGNSASRGPRLISNALTPYKINKLHRLHSPFRVRMGLRTLIQTFSFATLETLQTNDKICVIRSLVKTLRKRYWELSHDVTKIYPTKLLILLRSFTLMMFKSS